jgi:hypothetical protein
MVTIRTITKSDSDKEVLENMSNRVYDLNRLIFEGIVKDTKLEDAALVRVIQVHLEELNSEIEILKSRAK